MLRLRQNFNAIIGEAPIGGDDRQIVNQGCGNNQPVTGVFVDGWQSGSADTDVQIKIDDRDSMKL